MSSNWRRNLWAVCGAELLAIAGFSAFWPIIPYYIQFLGVQGAAVATWAGMISAVASLTRGVAGPFWGALSDRYGRKLMVERAMFAGCILTLLMGLAHNVEQLTLLRLLQGALTGTMTAAMTLVASVTPRERLGETLGRLQLAIYLGQSLGPLAGGLVADHWGYRSVFGMTSAFLGGAGLIVLLLVRENFTPVMREEHGPLTGQLRRDWKLLFAGSLLGLVLLLRFALGVGARMTRPLAPLLVQELLPESQVLGISSGLAATLNGISGAGAALLLGRAADRHGGRRILLLCALLGGGALILQGSAPTYGLFLIGQLLLGLATGGTLVTLSAYLGRLAPRGRAGAVYGLDTLAMALSNALGPFAGGWLARWFSLRAPFVVGGILMGLAGLAVLRLPPKGEKTPSYAGG